MKAEWKGRWYDGSILTVNGNGTFDVLWKKEKTQTKSIPRELIRKALPDAKYETDSELSQFTSLSVDTLNPTGGRIDIAVPEKSNWRIVELPNGSYQTEYKHPESNDWVAVTRRETREGAEAAIRVSIERYSLASKLATSSVREQQAWSRNQPAKHRPLEYTWAFKGKTWGFNAWFDNVPFTVCKVFPGRQAEQGGVQVGDQITRVDGAKLGESNRTEMKNILKAGGKHKITFKRCLPLALNSSISR